jgi:pimeloyl-ACP methyl ester carboxylesterase
MPSPRNDTIPSNYRIDGDEGLPMLVLSHGLGLDLTMWGPQMPALTGEFRVLRYDTRGHGGSPPSTAPCTIEALGRDALALLDRLGIRAPERLDKLVLAHTGALIGERSVWDTRIATVNAHGMRAISDAAMARWFTPEFLTARPAVVAAMKRLFERTPVDGYVQCCAAIRDGDFRDDIGRIKVPTLVLSGMRDPATTLVDGRFLAENIAGSAFVPIDSAHLSNVEKPAEFTAALLGFLREEARE